MREADITPRRRRKAGRPSWAQKVCVSSKFSRQKARPEAKRTLADAERFRIEAIASGEAEATRLVFSAIS